MAVAIQLDDELAERARVSADRAGKGIADFVKEAVEEKLARPTAMEESSLESSSKWRQEFRAWIARHEPLGHFVNDSRESIYWTRG